MEFMFLRARQICLMILLTGTSAASAGSFEDFFAAISQDNAEKISELLVKGFDANTSDSKGQTGLYIALR